MLTEKIICDKIISFVSNNKNFNQWISIRKIADGKSIFFFKSMIAKVKFSKQNNCFYIAIQMDYVNEFNHVSLQKMRNVKGWIRFPIVSVESLNLLEDSFSKLYSLLESDYSNNGMFGCCHLYEQCSDKKQCIHKDIVFSNCCWYKENLKNNKIFYGKNKNVHTEVQNVTK